MKTWNAYNWSTLKRIKIHLCASVPLSIQFSWKMNWINMTSSHFHFVSTELSQRKTTTQIYFFVLIFVSVSRENCSNRQRVEDAEREGQRGRETDRERGGGGGLGLERREKEKDREKRPEKKKNCHRCSDYNKTSYCSYLWQFILSLLPFKHCLDFVRI